MTLIIGFLLSIAVFYIVPKSKSIIAVCISSFIIAMIAYHLTDKNQYDLVYHRQLYDTIIDGGFSSAVVYSQIDRSPLYIWFVYLLSFFKNNKLISAVPTFCGYFTLGFMLIKSYWKEKLSLIIAFAFLIFVLPWQDYAAGVRGALAYSVCIWAIFLDLRKGKKLKSVPFYLTSIFIHQASIIFIFIRLLLLAIRHRIIKERIVYILCLALGSLTKMVSSILDSIAQSTGLRILSTVSHSFDSYVVKGTKLYEFGIVFVRLAAILLFYYVYTMSNSKVARNKDYVYKLYTMLMLVTIGFSWQYDIVCRYSFACILLSSMMLGYCKKQYMSILLIFATINLLFYYSIYYIHWQFIF